MTNIINLLGSMSTTLPFCSTSVPEHADAAAHLLAHVASSAVGKVFGLSLV
jgi:hypothetical protein